MKRNLKDLGKLGLRKMFEMGQRIGINVLPCHFYSEIPNIRELKTEDHWKKPSSMIGIRGAEIETQFDFARECCNEELIDRQRKKDIYDYACRKNGDSGYGSIEADFLYCFIYNKKPKKIVQVGCGVSTAVILLAAEEAGYSPEIICIDPYPTQFLVRLQKEKIIKLIAQKAQLVSIETMTDLGNQGFLFVDSTHTVKPGSEVNKLILEILPRLKKGGWVHFHDIYFPFDYSRHILTTELFFQNETALLHGFLINNCKYSLKVALSMLHYANPEELKKLLPNYSPAGNQFGLNTSRGHFPSSAYLEVVE